jgi:recombinational DNA repair protein RecR
MRIKSKEHICADCGTVTNLLLDVCGVCDDGKRTKLAKAMKKLIDKTQNRAWGEHERRIRNTSF